MEDLIKMKLEIKTKMHEMESALHGINGRSNIRHCGRKDKWCLVV